MHVIFNCLSGQAFCEEERKKILNDVQKVVTAPKGHNITIAPPVSEFNNESPSLPVRVIDNNISMPVNVLNPDATHPYRQKEIINLIKDNTADDIKLNNYDMRVVNEIFKIKSNIVFCYNPRYSSPQYSQAFVDWVLKKITDNNNFFIQSRQEFKKLSNSK